MEQHSYSNGTPHHSAQPAEPSHRRGSVTDRFGSQDENWSGDDSGDGPRKRFKGAGRGMSVSYVAIADLLLASSSADGKKLRALQAKESQVRSGPAKLWLVRTQRSTV